MHYQFSLPCPVISFGPNPLVAGLGFPHSVFSPQLCTPVPLQWLSLTSSFHYKLHMATLPKCVHHSLSALPVSHFATSDHFALPEQHLQRRITSTCVSVQCVVWTTYPTKYLQNVADNLSFDDFFSLGLSRRDFLFLLTEERICKSFVQIFIC
ncbi:hypothetical protein WAI453_000482 [Rhynchosporium graminicola]